MPKPVSYPFPIRALLPANSAFGKRPLYNDFHSGIDFNSTTGAYLGTPVRAAGDGVVVESYDGNVPGQLNWAKLRGTMVRIDHGDGWWTRYHMLDPNTNIARGTRVRAGDIIGHVGNSGSSGTGAHLHFELWRNGVAIDPVGQLTYNPGSFAGTTSTPLKGFFMALSDAEQKELLTRMRNVDNLAAWLYAGGPDADAGWPGEPGSVLRYVHDISDSVVRIEKNTQKRVVVRSSKSRPTILPADGSNVTLDEQQDNADTNSLLRILADRPATGAVPAIDYDKLATAIAAKLPTASVLTKEDVVDAIKSITLRAE